MYEFTLTVARDCSDHSISDSVNSNSGYAAEYHDFLSDEWIRNRRDPLLIQRTGDSRISKIVFSIWEPAIGAAPTFSSFCCEVQTAHGHSVIHVNI